MSKLSSHLAKFPSICAHAPNSSSKIDGIAEEEDPEPLGAVAFLDGKSFPIKINEE